MNHFDSSGLLYGSSKLAEQRYLLDFANFGTGLQPVNRTGLGEPDFQFENAKKKPDG
jgi:hypothetical protein